MTTATPEETTTTTSPTTTTNRFRKAGLPGSNFVRLGNPWPPTPWVVLAGPIFEVDLPKVDQFLDNLRDLTQNLYKNM